MPAVSVKLRNTGENGLLFRSPTTSTFSSFPMNTAVCAKYSRRSTANEALTGGGG